MSGTGLLVSGSGLTCRARASGFDISKPGLGLGPDFSGSGFEIWNPGLDVLRFQNLGSFAMFV